MIPPSEAHGILAHYFCADDAHRVQGALTEDDWRRGLDAYGSRLISASTWLQRALAGNLSDEVCATFDDGLREAYLHAYPALRDRGLDAAWNVYTQPLVGVPHSLERWRWVRNLGFGGVGNFYEVWWKELSGEHKTALEYTRRYLADREYLTAQDRRYRYWRNEIATPAEYEHVMTKLERQAGMAWPAHEHWLTAEDLSALTAKGHIIGLHGHRHPTTFAALSLEDQRVEWATSLHVLRASVPDIAVTTASYPCGEGTEASVEWFRKNGIRLAWGATMKGHSLLWESPRWSTGYWR